MLFLLNLFKKSLSKKYSCPGTFGDVEDVLALDVLFAVDVGEDVINNFNRFSFVYCL